MFGGLSLAAPVKEEVPEEPEEKVIEEAAINQNEIEAEEQAVLQ